MTAKASAARKGTQVSSLSDFEFKPYVPKKGEEYMNDAQLAHFKEILLSWKRTLMAHSDQTIQEMRSTNIRPPDPADEATQEENFYLQLRTSERKGKLLKKIDQSLASINEKEYGYCATCGIEIGIKRLEARPTATLCVECKTLDEIKEKRTSV